MLKMHVCTSAKDTFRTPQPLKKSSKISQGNQRNRT